MATISSTFNCNICAENYTETGDQAPVLFQCGHGCCAGCASRLVVHALRTTTQAPTCHHCRAVMHMTAPNYELLNQMRNASEEMVKLVAAKNKAVNELEKIRTKMIDAAVNVLLNDPSPAILYKKLEETIPTLLEFEIYKNFAEAQEDLLGRVQEVLLIGAFTTFDHTAETDLGKMIMMLAEKFAEYGESSAEELASKLKQGYIEYCKSREIPIPETLLN